MSIKITGYEALCNLGNNIKDIYSKAIRGEKGFFETNTDCIKTACVLGKIDTPLKEIEDENFNTRCNRLILKNLELLQDKIDNVIKKYSKERIGIICATTNSGVEEYETSKNENHYKLSNPSYFVKKYLSLENIDITVSVACASGLKGFMLARDFLNSNVCDCIILVCTDTISKLPVFGFSALEVLSYEPSIPFSKNRKGMNIGEASCVFIIEKDVNCGIEILGLGETSDTYHSTSPDPCGKKIEEAILNALNDASIAPFDIDYINAHGTGTIANDKAEASGIYKVFKDKVPVSSTKQLTGHCLGAASGIETALCCMLLENFDGRLYPHIYDMEYDDSIEKIKLVKKGKVYKKCNVCMCNSFGFGGSNAILILRGQNG